MNRSSALRLGGPVLVTLALAVAPAAQAAPAGTSVPVCNQASPHFQGGGLVALDSPVDSPAARFTNDLTVLPGIGDGLVTAAGKSPALTICDGDNGGGVVAS